MAAVFDSSGWLVVDEQGEDCSQILLKTSFNERDGSYDGFLFDGLRFWQETVVNDAFKVKCKEFNPNVEADPVYLLKELKQNCGKLHHGTKFSLSKVDEASESCELSVKFKLQAGVPFCWKFKLSKASERVIASQLTIPMLSMLNELQRRQDQLFKILEKKDSEILDFREQGFHPSKKNIETTQFDAKSFIDESFKSKTLHKAVQNPMSAFLDRNIKSLYENVMRETVSLRQTVQGKEVTGDETFSTQPIGRTRAIDQTNLMEEAQISPDVEEDAVTDIDKITELKRREKIEKRLAEQQKGNRGQKKVKKINL